MRPECHRLDRETGGADDNVLQFKVGELHKASNLVWQRRVEALPVCL